jgi:hypothetical protein
MLCLHKYYSNKDARKKRDCGTPVSHPMRRQQS